MSPAYDRNERCQARKLAAGLCRQCSRPVAFKSNCKRATLCAKCLVVANARAKRCQDLKRSPEWLAVWR